MCFTRVNFTMCGHILLYSSGKCACTDNITPYDENALKEITGEQCMCLKCHTPSKIKDVAEELGIPAGRIVLANSNHNLVVDHSDYSTQIVPWDDEKVLMWLEDRLRSGKYKIAR